MKFTELYKSIVEGADAGAMGSADAVDASVNDPGASNSIYIATYGNKKKKFTSKDELDDFLKDNSDWDAKLT